MEEPIFLEPVFKNYIWGGDKIKTYLKKESPYDITAESWEISTNKDGQSVIKNGEMNGKTLSELFNKKEMRKNIFGIKTETLSEFPLLIKFIDARDNLSIQVHPNDEYAKKIENSNGKTEMWYIVDCEKDAKIICGLNKKLTKEELAKIINENKIESYLNQIKVRKGDFIYIPAGTLHAIMKGCLICEIQQNSNITYRVYDWNRIGKDGKPRELHKEKAIDVIDLNKISEIFNTSYKNETLINSEFFKVEKIVGDVNERSNIECFYAMNVVKGEGKLITHNKEYKLKLGDSFIIPANLGEYKINGNIELLKTYI